MSDYESLLMRREEEIDGVSNWLWISTDTGAWTGPKNDWLSSHKAKFLEKVRKFDVCVQAGGNQGMYPRLLSQHFKTVYTFEPDPLNFHCLVNNCQLDNVVKINGALGDKRGMIRVERSSMVNTGMHRVSSYGESRTVPMFTIDDLNLEACDLICLDVEGHELSVLEGASETIMKFKPVITAENGGKAEEFLSWSGYYPHTSSVSDTIFVPRES